MQQVYFQKINELGKDFQNLLDATQFSNSFSKGETVILKPNFVAPRENKTGATTNLQLIKLVAQRLKSTGAKPILLEVPGMEFKLEEVFDFLNIFEFCKKIDLPIFIPTNNDYETVPIPNGKLLKRAKVPKIVLSNKILNLPVLKTHVITGVTIGMKNIMGFCHDQTRKKMHVLGIHPTIADLNKLIKPNFTIVDGLNTMDGDGAVYGNVQETNFLLAGRHPFSVDKVCCDLININFNKIEYIKSAEKEGKIQVIGKPNKFDFQLPEQGKIYHFFYRLLYLVDIPFEWIFKKHFNEFLYKTGKFGTHPKINSDSDCEQCQKCIRICPTDAISAEFQINSKKCLRCLKCYDVCPDGKITISGFSNPQHYEKK